MREGPPKPWRIGLSAAVALYFAVVIVIDWPGPLLGALYILVVLLNVGYIVMALGGRR